jgi:hypothetical protein
MIRENFMTRNVGIWKYITYGNFLKIVLKIFNAVVTEVVLDVLSVSVVQQPEDAGGV